MTFSKHTYTIYMYTFPNGKRYIGKTIRTLNARQGQDWSRYKRCRLLWAAIQKYGTDSIHIDVLFYGDLTNEESSEMERYYIAEYKTNANRYSNPSYGYNLTDGGEGVPGWKPTYERRDQLVEQMREIGKGHAGKTVSDTTRKRLSESHKGIRLGYKMPEETKRKIGEANSLKNMTSEEREHRKRSKMKKVLAFNPTTGEKLIFESRDIAAEHFGVRSSAVSRWIDGTRNPSNSYVFSNYSPTTTE